MAHSTRPSTPQRVRVGDTVLVHLDDGELRPMVVSSLELLLKDGEQTTQLRLYGTIFCCPGDKFTALDGGSDPAQIHGQPSLHNTALYGAALKEGSGPGQWVVRPTNLSYSR